MVIIIIDYIMLGGWLLSDGFYSTVIQLAINFCCLIQAFIECSTCMLYFLESDLSINGLRSNLNLDADVWKLISDDEELVEIFFVLDI